MDHSWGGRGEGVLDPRGSVIRGLPTTLDTCEGKGRADFMARDGRAKREEGGTCQTPEVQGGEGGGRW